MASTLRSDGSGGDLLSLPAVYHNPIPTLGPEYLYNGHKNNTIKMSGRQVFRFATNVVSDVIEDVLEKAELTIEDVDLIVPHQANRRIVETSAKKLGISIDRFYLNHEGEVQPCEFINVSFGNVRDMPFKEIFREKSNAKHILTTKLLQMLKVIQMISLV